MELNLKDRIYSYLIACHSCRGRAIKAADLAFKFDTNLREINEIIRQLRKDGNLIGSAKEPPFGYYIPVTDTEVKAYLDSFKNELFDMLNTFNRQKRAQRNFIERKNYEPENLFPVEVGEAGQMEMVMTGN